MDFASTAPPDGPLYAAAAADAAASGQFQHVFCGDNTTPGAQCPNCHKPLLQILSLDLADPRLNGIRGAHSRFPFLYCWRCNIVTETFYYRLVESGGVAIVEFARGTDEGLADDVPDYPESFPVASARLLAMSEDAEEYVRQLNDDEAFDDSGYPDEITGLDRCIHQVGGEPYLINGDSYGPVHCPTCGKSMSLLASLGTQTVDPRGMLIVEVNNYVQIIYHYCAACSIVAALNESD